ncbi:hypothetical protein TSTA_097930 [Talaromyces stipitatus ATCC 10500]|uniref:Uncharacterized protein n=1 Tax=Talaromyces stipitatus (strain ATCC 10500 / CBS 375.48 / QM 6759 / NRRL 1006) TaxID=441959 RepID=B8MM25_TALSN|nr:uncharacterized protein TSTA_097930 [Talaromyces stipitatus ATCC 10500]EED13537.1 hypothetical protein TSTA_097930 [Talaromyces stipitatus ATCC 10500]
MEVIADDQGAPGARSFLDFVEKNQHSLHFLDRDRAYLITEVDPTLANQVSWPQRNADVADMFLFMLKSHWISGRYYEEYPDSDFTELWEASRYSSSHAESACNRGGNGNSGSIEEHIFCLQTTEGSKIRANWAILRPISD